MTPDALLSERESSLERGRARDDARHVEARPSPLTRSENSEVRA